MNVLYGDSESYHEKHRVKLPDLLAPRHALSGLRHCLKGFGSVISNSHLIHASFMIVNISFAGNPSTDHSRMYGRSHPYATFLFARRVHFRSPLSQLQVSSPRLDQYIACHTSVLWHAPGYIVVMAVVVSLH